jgi:hypothetical protein
LTTKDQFRNFRENHENHCTTPKDSTTDPGSYSWKLLLIKDARVHYVVLKQQPQTTHPTHTTPKKRGRNMHDRCSQETRNKQTRNKHTTARKPRRIPPGPVASGPNSVPNTKPPNPRPRRSRTTAPPKKNSIRTKPGQKPDDRYLLIFHP